MHRWKITYEYPPNYEKEFVTHFIDQKRKPDKIHEKHRFVGVIAVTIEEIPVDPHVWNLKNVLQSLVDAYNRYVEIEHDDAYLQAMFGIIRHIESSIHHLEGNIFTIEHIHPYLYIKSTNLHNIRKEK